MIRTAQIFWTDSPSMQTQVKRPRASRQVPSFWHGSEAHSFMLRSHLGPAYPSTQSHRKDPGVFTHVPPCSHGLSHPETKPLGVEDVLFDDNVGQNVQGTYPRGIHSGPPCSHRLSTQWGRSRHRIHPLGMCRKRIHHDMGCSCMHHLSDISDLENKMRRPSEMFNKNNLTWWKHGTWIL